MKKEGGKRSQSSEKKKPLDQPSQQLYIDHINRELYKRNVELAFRNKTLSLLRKLYDLILKTPKLDPLGNQLVWTIQKELNLPLVGIFILSGDQTLKPLSIAYSDRLRSAFELLRVSFPFIFSSINLGKDETIYRRIIDTQKPRAIENFVDLWPCNNREATALSEVQKKTLIATSMVYPLITDHNPLGFLIFSLNRKYQNLSDFELDTFESFINVIAVALDKSLIYEQLRTANIELSEATKMLRELVKMKSDFLTVASHQLRTPTSIVRGMLSIVTEEENLSAEEKNRFLHQAYEGINRLERIIHDLLNATELEGEKMRLEIQETSIEPIVEEAVKSLKPLADAKNVELNYTAQQKIPKLLIDPFKFKEVLSNLIDNAIRYNMSGGTVRIEVAKIEDQVKVTIQDTGIGMTRNDQKNLFQKFVRGEGILQIHPNGSGLGLFIAKKMMEAMGGEVMASSPGKGKGSTFTVVISV